MSELGQVHMQDKTFMNSSYTIFTFSSIQKTGFIIIINSDELILDVWNSVKAFEAYRLVQFYD